MTPLPLEFQDLLKSFNTQGLQYLLVGGWAVGYPGHVRQTLDIDFWISVSPENADKLIQACLAFIGVAPTRQSILKSRKTTEFGNPPLKVHIMCDISGVEFAACYAKRTEADWNGKRVPVIGFEDLMVNKKSTGRFKNLADVDFLTKLKKRKQKRERK